MKQILISTIGLLISFVLGGCSSEVNQQFEILQNQKESKQWSDTIQVNPCNATILELKNNTGYCDVKCVNGDYANIRVECKFEAATQKVLDECAEHMKLYVAEENQVFHVGMIEKDSGTDFWTWLQSKYGNSVSFIADFYVTIPEQFQRFSVNNQVGTVKISDAKGLFSLENGVGDIILKDSVVMGNSQLKTNIGSIEFAPQSVSGNAEICTGTGDIRLTFVDGTVGEGELSAITDTGYIMFFANYNVYSLISDHTKGSEQSCMARIEDCYTVNMQTKNGSVRF